MMFRELVAPVLLACLFVSPAVATDEAAPPPKADPAQPLPTAVFARLPLAQDLSLSPSGKYVAGRFAVDGSQKIAVMPTFPIEGETNFVAPLPDGTEVDSLTWVNDDDIVVTLNTLMPVIDDRWYVRRMFSINRKTQKILPLLRDLGGQDTADILWVPADGSREILVAAQNSIYSDDDLFWPTVYRVDVETGKRKVELAGRTGFTSWYADADGAVRMGLGYDDEKQASRLLYRSGASGSFRQVDRASHRRDESIDIPLQFVAGGDKGLVLREGDDGKSAIYEMDLVTRELGRPYYVPETGTIWGVVPSNDGKTMLGVLTSDWRKPYHWLDPDMAALQDQLDGQVKNGRVIIDSMNSDRSKFLVRIDAPDNPGTIYFYDKANPGLQKYMALNESIGGRKLGPVRTVHYKARDGLDIEAVLTLPRGREAKKLPLVVMPHGGPWARDTLDYDYWSQFLASRGYAVLRPNFRGSTGYGSEFTRKGEGQMGLAMQDDITDAVQWIAAQGIADIDRVCIVGASYGGYAAMWGIAKDPDLYKCAISIAGVSNIRRDVNDFGGTLQENLFKSQWQAMAPDFDAISPIKAVARIKTPLLLIHGKKDVTVDSSQSEKMYAAMKNAGKTVEIVPLPLADHHFTREEDRLKLLTAMEAFLAKYLPPN